ncbi:hypothetical protein GCM10010171_57570 [Actinokineospora fastidiosa]|uniref:Uncharacterized protein n=1 Tax=Actinokineospora fastidiosa TaxID=1816 RepID=A0A918GSA9_9PSEU|nr:hypothetical protein GCM10010171_57570 [Actinokineospora fastidiosa]
MRASVRAELVSGQTWRFYFSRWQKDAICGCFSLMTSLAVSSNAIRVQVGASIGELRILEAQFASAVKAGWLELAEQEVHVVHAVLLSSVEQFAVEEAFHVRIGFYRENIRDLVEESFALSTRIIAPARNGCRRDV